jgi:hypothetical protein
MTLQRLSRDCRDWQGMEKKEAFLCHVCDEL